MLTHLGSLLLEGRRRNETCIGGLVLAVTVGLPPIGILTRDHVEHVTAIEAQAKLLARRVCVVLGVVGVERFHVDLGGTLRMRKTGKMREEIEM